MSTPDIDEPWKIRHRATIGEVRISGKDGFYPEIHPPPSKIPDYIMLTAGNDRVALRTRERRGAKGSTIFVAKGTLSKVDDESTATFTGIGKARFNWEQVRSGARGRVVLAGLLFVAIGLVIQGGLTVGRGMREPFIVMSEAGLLFWGVVAIILQVAGVVMAFLERHILNDE
ncbi:hypothetical protein [Pseudonocardia sp. NPDC046786]|uniref:hypothetical protein n=1 Tax=Pseudonocardia sp. NPDC046786 TaxID=3155471 RepID=UPI0033C894E0